MDPNQMQAMRLSKTNTIQKFLDFLAPGQDEKLNILANLIHTIVVERLVYFLWSKYLDKPEDGALQLLFNKYDIKQDVAENLDFLDVVAIMKTGKPDPTEQEIDASSSLLPASWWKLPVVREQLSQTLGYVFARFLASSTFPLTVMTRDEAFDQEKLNAFGRCNSEECLKLFEDLISDEIRKEIVESEKSSLYHAVGRNEMPQIDMTMVAVEKNEPAKPQ